MAAIGIPLATCRPEGLRKVPAHIDRNPALSLDLPTRLGEPFVEWVRDRYGDEDEVDLKSLTHRIPMDLYRRLSLDEILKVRHSTRFMMDASVEDAFESEPHLAVYRKIVSSMWRWGGGRPAWSEVVDAWDGIGAFSLGHPDFELTLDHTTSFNECGWSEHSRTFLDGPFGYLVRHKGEHVMTLGFALMTGRRLLIQQVQLRNRRGNRWLFKLPRNYLEHVVERFRDAFPRHRVLVVDGADVMGKSLASYREGLARAERLGAEAARRLRACKDEDAVYHREDVERHAQEASRLRECIAHAEPEVARLQAFYAAVGRFVRGRTLTVNRLRHYEVLPAAETRDVALAA